MIFLNYIIGTTVDLMMTLLAGGTFYLLWGWLIVPTLDVVAISLPAAIAIVFVADFVIAPINKDVVTPDNFWEYVSEGGGRIISRCFAYLILGFALSLVLI